ncbi:oxidized low-density lipoprotein receptor 1-like isoform X2 [Hypanus sabinus]|nr:oxidized low-density lipoprotein receptor 1-like isoform X2 [Hypanus sabinus]
MRVTVQTAAHEQQSKVKIGNRPYRLICLLCLVTSALIVIVVGLSIHGEWNGLRVQSDRMHSDLRHQFTEMETKYRSVNETKAQICELLTSRREQTCSKDWMKNKDRCYYVSTFEASFRQAMEECSNRDSRLLEINSRDEASFASNKLLYRNIALWIGKCENG